MFAPGFAELPIQPHWQRQADGTMAWTGVMEESPVHPDSIANYTECADERFGASDYYASVVS